MLRVMMLAKWQTQLHDRNFQNGRKLNTVLVFIISSKMIVLDKHLKNG